MIIAVISDIHDNIANLKTCLDWCRRHQVKKIISCGDLTDSETLNYLAANFAGEIFVIDGNAELYESSDLAKYPNITTSGDIGIQEIGKLHIGFTHQPEKIKKILKAASPAPDFIFYGHTHKPWLEHNGSTIIANPGNLAGIFHQATFAVLNTDTKNLDLKIVADLK